MFYAVKTALCRWASSCLSSPSQSPWSKRLHPALHPTAPQRPIAPQYTPIHPSAPQHSAATAGTRSCTMCACCLHPLPVPHPASSQCCHHVLPVCHHLVPLMSTESVDPGLDQGALVRPLRENVTLSPLRYFKSLMAVTDVNEAVVWGIGLRREAQQARSGRSRRDQGHRYLMNASSMPVPGQFQASSRPAVLCAMSHAPHPMPHATYHMLHAIYPMPHVYFPSPCHGCPIPIMHSPSHNTHPQHPSQHPSQAPFPTPIGMKVREQIRLLETDVEKKHFVLRCLSDSYGAHPR